MTDKQHLLYFDNHPAENHLVDYFNQFNIQTIQKNTLAAIDQIQTKPVAILINWALLESAPSVIKTLYRRFTVPLIVIIENDDEDSSIKALETGADDVLIKPINPRELHARISAINRRVLRSQKSNQENKDVITFANWRLYPASRQVFDKNNNELMLSAGEYELLYAFVQQPQQILNREYLLQVTKQTDHSPLDRRIDVQISRLRQKIEPNTKKPGLIRTIRNSGYLFTTEVLYLKESDL